MYHDVAQYHVINVRETSMRYVRVSAVSLYFSLTLCSEYAAFNNREVDGLLAQAILTLKQSNVLKNTILVLASPEGLNRGKHLGEISSPYFVISNPLSSLIESLQGQIDHKIPLFYMIAPNLGFLSKGPLSA